MNYLFACAVAVPCRLSQAGLPIGMQMVGASGADHLIGDLANALFENLSPGEP